MTPDDWFVFPWCKDMEATAQRLGGAINDVWAKNPPKSELILTDKKGDQNIVGSRGHWALKQLLNEWYVVYEESPVFPDRGDKYDFNILSQNFGTSDVKTEQIHNPDIMLPDRVMVNKKQSLKPVRAYVFGCWHSYRRLLWIMGWMGREEFINTAKLYTTKDKLPRQKVKADVYVLAVERVYPMKLFKELIIPKFEGPYQQLSLF